MSSGISVSSRGRHSAPDPGGFNPLGLKLMTGEEPGGQEPVSASPLLPDRHSMTQPPTPVNRGKQQKQQQQQHQQRIDASNSAPVMALLMQSPPSPPRGSANRSRKRSSEYAKISPISTANTESTTESASPPHPTAGVSLVEQRLRAARAIYESDTLMLPTEPPEYSHGRPSQSATPVHKTPQASPTSSLATEPHRNTHESSSAASSTSASAEGLPIPNVVSGGNNRRKSGGRRRRSKTPEKRRSKTPEPHRKTPEKRRSKTPDPQRRRKTPEKRRGAEDDQQNNNGEDRKGFFRKLFRRNKKDIKTDGSEMEETKTSTSTRNPTLKSSSSSVSSVAPPLRMAASDPVQKLAPNHATTMETVHEEQQDGLWPSQSMPDQPRRRSDSKARRTIAQNPTTSMDESLDDRQEVFFAQDDVSTLTGPTVHDDYNTSSSRNHHHHHRTHSSEYMAGLPRDPVESLPHTASTLSADPMGFYFQAYGPGAAMHDPEEEPYDEAPNHSSIRASSSSASSSAVDPFTEPFFNKSKSDGSMSRKLHIITEPVVEESPTSQQHDDPVGESPLSSRHRRRRQSREDGNRERRQSVQDPSPRGYTPAEPQEHQDPLGASPVHAHDRGPSAVVDGHLYAPDPPLYHGEDSDSSASGHDDEPASGLDSVMAEYGGDNQSRLSFLPNEEEEKKDDENSVPPPPPPTEAPTLTTVQGQLKMVPPPPPPPPPPPGSKKKSKSKKGPKIPKSPRKKITPAASQNSSPQSVESDSRSPSSNDTTTPAASQNSSPQSVESDSSNPSSNDTTSKPTESPETSEEDPEFFQASFERENALEAERAMKAKKNAAEIELARKAKEARKAKKAAEEVEFLRNLREQRAKKAAQEAEFLRKLRESKKQDAAVFDSDTGEPVVHTPQDVSPPKGKTTFISSLARMNAKAVAYLHTLNGQPSPRHQWHAPTVEEEEMTEQDSDTGGPSFQAYSTKFKGRKLTARTTASPRSSGSKNVTPRSTKREPSSPSWMNKPHSRDVSIHAQSVLRGIAIRKAERDALIDAGMVERVVRKAPVRKVAKEKSPAMPEPVDPIQRAGRRLLARAAVPIQSEIRRFLAQREAVDRMWALIEIQSYMRRWRAEVHMIACVQAVIVLQSIVRGHIARASVKKQHSATTQIQRVVRGYLASVWAYDTVYSVILIQAQARRFLVVRRLALERAGEAALTIQTQWRRYQAQITLLYDLVHIIMVQSVVRRRMAMKVAWKHRIEYEDKYAAATRIQAKWRGFWQFSHYVIMHYEACRIQAASRGMVARRSYKLKIGSVILIQSACRRSKEKCTLANRRRALILTASHACRMRERLACEKIQLWWSVVVECQKEKKAALIIERFFIMLKKEVEKEVRKYEEKQQVKREKRRRKKRETDKDEEMLERVWLNTVDENHVDVFAVPSSNRSTVSRSGPSPSMSSVASPTPKGPSSSRYGRLSRHSASSPSMNLVMRHENASPGTSEAQSSFSFSSSHLSNRVNELKEKVSKSDFDKTHVSIEEPGLGDAGEEQERKKRAADKYLKMYGVKTAPNRYSREFFGDNDDVSTTPLARPASTRQSLDSNELAAGMRTPGRRSPSKAKLVAQKYLQQRQEERKQQTDDDNHQARPTSLRVDAILGDGIGMI